MSVNTLTTPREGIHAHRIPYLDIATIDTVGTVGAGYVISKYTGWSFLTTTIGLFALSIPVHHYFRVNSTLHDKAMEVLGIDMEKSDAVQTVPSSGSCPFH